MIISERIFMIMEEKGLSQIEFARKTGISQSTISDWKRKKTNPASDKIMVICEVLGVSPYDLLQDTTGRGKEIEYRVVTPGTDNYDILERIENLDPKKKERLIGYLSALE